MSVSFEITFPMYIVQIENYAWQSAIGEGKQFEYNTISLRSLNFTTIIILTIETNKTKMNKEYVSILIRGDLMSLMHT